jgi:hypothetical protein
MRDDIVSNLSNKIDPSVVEELVKSYEAVITRYRKGDIDGCLSVAGKFVEHTLRAIEFVRTGAAPTEIMNASSTAATIEKDKSLPEAVRRLIPRVASSMIYDIRSKRGAVHVKEINPRHIDASLAVHSASWIMAEFLRLYHVSGEAEVSQAMIALMRAHVPFIEVFGDEVVVTRAVTCETELLLLLVKAEPDGLDRRALGEASKYKPPTVTTTLQRLEGHRYVHKMKSGRFRVTGSGEHRVSELIAAQGQWSAPSAKVA